MKSVMSTSVLEEGVVVVFVSVLLVGVMFGFSCVGVDDCIYIIKCNYDKQYDQYY